MITSPLYDFTFAKGWHTYQLIWRPDSLEFKVDGVLYWKVVGAKVLWRCMTYRFILRTDAGLDTPAGDIYVYLRRFKYTTLKSYLEDTLID